MNVGKTDTGIYDDCKFMFNVKYGKVAGRDEYPYFAPKVTLIDEKDRHFKVSHVWC